MRRCHRCYYLLGLTDTRCRICGAKVPRVRASVIAVVGLIAGLTVGWATLHLI